MRLSTHTALLMLMLAACQPYPSQPGGSIMVPPGAQDCGVAGLQPYLGRNVADLPQTGPWGTVRVIRPGMGVTMDYSATRLNVQVDEQGTIQELSCG